MSDSKVIFTVFNTTPDAANDSVYDQPEPPTPHEERLRCELWFGCESMTCRIHGCMNASGNHGGAAACPPPSSFIPCSTSTN